MLCVYVVADNVLIISCSLFFFLLHFLVYTMTSIENNFRSLSRLAAECQRQVERLYHVDSITVQKEVAELIRSSIRCLATDIEVKLECSANLHDFH